MSHIIVTPTEVLDTILDRIVYLELKPSESILDIEFAQEFHVSRTPVREAFFFLKQAGFIDIYPQSGTFVSLIDVELIREILYIRHALEREILLDLMDKRESVCVRVEKYIFLQELTVREGNQKDYVKNDHLFHEELFAAAGHKRAWELFQDRYVHTTRFHMLDFYDSKNVFATSLQEHKDIIRSLENGNKEELIKVMVIHHDCEICTAERMKR